jgi:FKBP-type peptidyl-prolyl cis-trans isomerase FklB
LLTSCSEQDDEDNEFVNWQERNETYFNDLYTQTSRKIASGDNSWQLIRCFTKSDSATATKPEQYIIAQCIEAAPDDQTDMPLYTDTVNVHYRGWLIPSKNFPEGYVFDSSFRGDFDVFISAPSEFGLNSSLVIGFSTALQHMRRGDHWKVWIPYQLGYGSTANGAIPAYSTLIFELWLENFY